MLKNHKDLWVAIGIGVIQAIVTTIVTVVVSGKWFLPVILIAVGIIACALMYFHLNAKIKLYERVGIVDCTEELKETRFEPKQCMKDVTKYLDFMGVGGNKWVDQDDKIILLKSMLERVSASNGKVRYLLINPNCERFRTLAKLRKEMVPNRSYLILKNLMKQYDCLEVRLYDDLPSFRLQFVDQEYVAVSRYFVEHDAHEREDFGWKTPHLVVRAERTDDISGGKREHQASLYKSFEQLYQFIWQRSISIQDVNLTKEDI